MIKELYAHQRQGATRIAEDGGVHGLLWDVGTGKTATVISYLEGLQLELDRPIKVLVVAPKSVMRTWISQFQEHCSEQWMMGVLETETIPERVHRIANWTAPADISVLVVGYPTFSNKQHKEKVLAAFKRNKFDVMICDEAHALRGDSNMSRLMGRISPHVPRRIAMTGTPMPNGPGDVWGLWRWLDPEAFWNPRLNKYASKGHFDGVYGKATNQYGAVVAWDDEKLPDMHERIAKRSSAMKKDECLDLPPATVVPILFDLSVKEQKHYNEMKTQMLTVVDDETITVAQKITAILRLRQVTSGFLPFEDGSIAQIGTTRHDLAVDLIENITASEDRLVVFGWSRHELDALHATLLRNPPWGARIQRIAGDTPTLQRQAQLERFGNPLEHPERTILLAQISTLNSGVNDLVTASNAIYLSMTQRRDEWVQSLGRLDRPGQAYPVTYHVLAARNTVDTQILQAFESKAKLEDALITHIKENR